MRDQPLSLVWDVHIPGASGTEHWYSVPENVGQWHDKSEPADQDSPNSEPPWSAGPVAVI